MARWINNPEKTLTGPNNYRVTIEGCNEINRKQLNFGGKATEPQGGDSLYLLLLLRLSEWATLSLVPFSKL